MKGLVLYLGVMIGGAAAGAVGVGSYNVFVVGIESDTTAVVDGTLAAADHGEDAPSDVSTDPALDPATPDDATGPESEPDGGTGEDAGETQEEQPTEGEGEVGSLESAAGPAESTPEVEAEPPPDPAEVARTQQNYQRLARIFGAMKPDEAAPVLAQLSDGQLEGILMAMQGRTAAPILAAMDPARVASISRRVLGGNQ